MLILLTLLTTSQIDILGDVVRIQKEIQIINLVNGLELSQNKMRLILRKAQEVERIKHDFHKEIIEDEEVILEILKRLRENRMAQHKIPEELNRTVNFAVEELLDSKHEMFESIERITTEVCNILDSNQIYQLEHYIPCLIPPPGDAKIGQSEKSIGITEKLTKLRKMPDWLYEMKKNDIVDMTVSKMKKHLPQGVIYDEEAERERLFKLFDEIRSIDEVDFFVKRDDYAEMLKGEHFKRTTSMDVSSKIEKFLIDPLIIPILKEKINN